MLSNKLECLSQWAITVTSKDCSQGQEPTPWVEHAKGPYKEKLDEAVNAHEVKTL
jgi:hypothetical protein